MGPRGQQRWKRRIGDGIDSNRSHRSKSYNDDMMGLHRKCARALGVCFCFIRPSTPYHPFLLLPLPRLGLLCHQAPPAPCPRAPP